MPYWSNRSVLVTGGASLIGAHLVRELVEQGAAVRIADDFSSGRRVLGWEPRTSFADGLSSTVDWYVGTKDREEVRAQLPRLLTERPLPIHAGSVGAAGLEPATSAL